MIGFIAPGLLALLPTDAQLTHQVPALLLMLNPKGQAPMPCTMQASRWSKAPGYSLIALGLLQCVTGVGSQLMSES